MASMMLVEIKYNGLYLLHHVGSCRGAYYTSGGREHLSCGMAAILYTGIMHRLAIIWESMGKVIARGLKRQANVLRPGHR